MKRLIKFEAPWCTKCKQMDTIIEAMEIPYHVECIDVDDNTDAAMFFGVRSIPHMILLDENNNIVARVNGLVTKQQLKEALELQ